MITVTHGHLRSHRAWAWTLCWEGWTFRFVTDLFKISFIPILKFYNFLEKFPFHPGLKIYLFFAVLRFDLRAYTLSHSTSPFLCWLFLRWGGLMNYLPRLALNRDPIDRCLLRSWDYRREHQHLTGLNI
jgi:hypothetical protein